MNHWEKVYKMYQMYTEFTLTCERLSIFKQDLEYFLTYIHGSPALP